jgi:hypothetical protein
MVVSSKIHTQCNWTCKYNVQQFLNYIWRKDNVYHIRQIQYLYHVSVLKTRAVSIIIGYGLDDWVQILADFFLFSTVFRETLGPPNLLSTGTLSLGVKQLGHEINHSVPHSTKFKNGEAVQPLPPYCSWHTAYLSIGGIFALKSKQLLNQLLWKDSVSYHHIPLHGVI